MFFLRWSHIQGRGLPPSVPLGVTLRWARYFLLKQKIRLRPQHSVKPSFYDSLLGHLALWSPRSFVVTSIHLSIGRYSVTDVLTIVSFLVQATDYFLKSKQRRSPPKIPICPFVYYPFSIIQEPQPSCIEASGFMLPFPLFKFFLVKLLKI